MSRIRLQNTRGYKTQQKVKSLLELLNSSLNLCYSCLSNCSTPLSCPPKDKIISACFLYYCINKDKTDSQQQSWPQLGNTVVNPSVKTCTFHSLAEEETVFCHLRPCPGVSWTDNRKPFVWTLTLTHCTIICGHDSFCHSVIPNLCGT